MFPMEGRGVVAYRDQRLRYLTLVPSTQFPHSVQTGLCECLGLDDGAVRIISPDVGGGFGYKGLLCREEVALGWLALQVNHPVRWLEDCREHLSANANCREHYYDITGYASREGKLLAIDCVGYVDAGAYSGLSDFLCCRGSANCQPAAGPLRFLDLPLPFRRRGHEQMPDHPVPRGRAHGHLPGNRSDHGCDCA
jgi:carbon-monoxide dehydrogenase large subunit